MNAMLLLAQVATNLADSVASANPVLTPVSAPAEMNMLDMAIKGDCTGRTVCCLFLHSVRT